MGCLGGIIFHPHLPRPLQKGGTRSAGHWKSSENSHESNGRFLECFFRNQVTVKMITWNRFCQFIGVTPDICGNIFCIYIYVYHLTTTCRTYNFLLPSKVRDWLSWFETNISNQQQLYPSSDFDTSTVLVKQVSRRVGWWKETTHIDWSTSGGKRQTRCRLDAFLAKLKYLQG